MRMSVHSTDLVSIFLFLFKVCFNRLSNGGKMGSLAIVFIGGFVVQAHLLIVPSKSG